MSDPLFGKVLTALINFDLVKRLISQRHRSSKQYGFFFSSLSAEVLTVIAVRLYEAIEKNDDADISKVFGSHFFLVFLTC